MRTVAFAGVLAVVCAAYAFSGGALPLSGKAAPSRVPNMSAPAGSTDPSGIMAAAFNKGSMPTVEELAGGELRVYSPVHMVSADSPRDTVDVTIIMARVCADGSEKQGCRLDQDKVKMAVFDRPVAAAQAKRELQNASSFYILKPGEVPLSTAEGSRPDVYAWRTTQSVVNSYIAIRRAHTGNLILRHAYHNYDTANLAPVYNYIPESRRPPFMLWHGYFPQGR
ncbi:MAG TPA: hypothetical protein PLL10_07580 [Elusimicrobiales bacterium]|nr:hypothetical protein [Elusimicrobiales bacterium]